MKTSLEQITDILKNIKGINKMKIKNKSISKIDEM